MASKQTITVEQLITAKEPKQLIEKLDFETALNLLEQLVASVERGQLTLDTSVESYEKGMALVEHLRGVLNKAEAKLKVVSAT